MTSYFSCIWGVGRSMWLASRHILMRPGWSRWPATSRWRSGGFLASGQYLIHDRDTKFCAAFQQIIADAGVERVVLPPRSPHLHAYAERWVRSVKEECLARVILFGEASLHDALARYGEHFHHERNHQGKGNVLLFPVVSPGTTRQGP